MIKSVTIAAAFAGMISLSGAAQAAPLSATAAPVATFAQSGTNLVETVQYRRYGYGRGYGYGPRYGYRGYRGGRGGAVGAGIAAGALGALAAGALLAPGPVYAAPAPVYPYAAPVYGAPVYGAPVYGSSDTDAVAYCSRRFRTYDPETGTYIANGGVVRACP